MKSFQPNVLLKGRCKITVGLRRKNRDFENYFGAKNCTLQTAQQLQKIHDTYWQGRPLIISSGWRSVRNNRNCGGVSNSRHLYGKAVDFNLGLPTIKKDYEIMDKYWKGYVLFEGTWIHAQW